MILLGQLILVLVMERRDIWSLFLFLRRMQMRSPQRFRLTKSPHFLGSKRSVDLVNFLQPGLIEIIVRSWGRSLKSVIFISHIKMKVVLFPDHLSNFLSWNKFRNRFVLLNHILYSILNIKFKQLLSVEVNKWLTTFQFTNDHTTARLSNKLLMKYICTRAATIITNNSKPVNPSNLLSWAYWLSRKPHWYL